MTIGGWLFLLVSCGFMTGLLGWCIWRIIATPRSTEHLHSQSDIEPDDLRTQHPQEP